MIKHIYSSFNLCILLLSISPYTSATPSLYKYDETFRVCGSYCGPGWCNNMWLKEEYCNATIPPEYHVTTGYSCADSCCQKHDICCGKNIKHKIRCNTNLVNCLSKCDHYSLTCTYNHIPIMAGAIELVMDIVQDWCCGYPC